MTALLVFAMAALMVTAHWYFSRQRRRVADRARSAVQFVEVGPSSLPADGALFHPGHTWVQLHGGGLASIGATAFAANFAGDVARIETPPQGRKLRQADKALTFVSNNGRRLDLPMPIDGEVLAVNADLRRDPGLTQRRPYDQGWVLRVRPRNVQAAARNLMPVAAARRWLDSTREAVAARVSALQGATAFDGGEWSPAFGERLAEKDWTELRRELFPIIQRGAADEPRGNAK